MKLLYLKILDPDPKSFFGFANNDLNFSGKYQFSYDKNTNTIRCLESEDYFENLYGQDINVTAIVGSNGVGKTSLLKYLQVFIAKLEGRGEQLSRLSDSWSYIAVIEKNETIEVATNFPGEKEIEINFTPLKGRSEYLSASIYYSPHFELEEPRSDRPNYIDVSTDMLFYHSVHQKEDDDQNVSATINFRQEEIKRQIHFAQFAERQLNKVNFQFYEKFLHKHINLSFSQYIKTLGSSSRFISTKDEDIYNQLDVLFLSADKTLTKSAEYSNESLTELAKLWFLKRLIEVVFYNVENRPEEFIGDIHRAPLQQKDRSVYKSVNAVLTFIMFLENLTCIGKDKKKGFIQNIRLVLDIFDHQNLHLIQGRIKEIRLGLDVAKKLMDLEKEILEALPYSSVLGLFKFDWDNLSTGEKAYFNLFSRLHYGYNLLKINGELKNSNHIYFFIDEPCTGFHPQWQKEYLAKLIEFVNIRIPEKKHLIIATHSPYLVSDLQKEDVIRLHKNGDHNKNIAENTFGANIHELLADSFYLQNGFMGDFARIKITSLIDFLESEDETLGEWDQRSARKFINIIGEPILRQDLKELYFTKFPQMIDDEIGRLQELKRKNIGNSL